MPEPSLDLSRIVGFGFELDSIQRMSSLPRTRSAKHRDDEAGRRPTGKTTDAAEREGESRTELEQMLRRAASGDQDAWRVLIESYSPRVFGLIRAQCGSADLAEEITQSAFCTVVAKIGSYTELGRFEQWLFRIAMNRLRDEMRRRKRQARPMEDESLHAMADSDVNISGGPGGGSRSRGDQLDPLGLGPGQVEPEQLKALRIALAELPDADQQIIHLRHNAGLSFKEIADILEQPLGTVLARQHRALKKLAEVLEPVVGRESSIGKVRRSATATDAPGGLDTQPSGP